MLARYGIVLGTVLIATVAPSAPASANTPLSCGDTITHNVVLTRDLTCTGTGLTIDAAGVTINLDGHQITGSGSSVGIGTGPDIRNANVDLAVRNGSIHGFGVGVDAEIVGSAHLENMDIEYNGRGVGTSAIVVTIFVRHCTFRANGAAIGSPIPQPSGGMIVNVNDSTFISNGIAIHVDTVSRSVTVASSVFQGNMGAINVFNGSLFVTNTQFTGNGQGITAALEGVVFTGSVVRHSAIGLDISDNFYFLTVWGNRFLDSGIGVRMVGVTPPSAQFADNTLSGNAAAGLFLNPLTGNVHISGNSFDHNGYAPGAYTDPSGRPLTAGAWANTGTFTSNVAIGNAGYGIEGYGVTDGGGNVARHNGNPAQCLGVVCATR